MAPAEGAVRCYRVCRKINEATLMPRWATARAGNRRAPQMGRQPARKTLRSRTGVAAEIRLNRR